MSRDHTRTRLDTAGLLGSSQIAGAFVSPKGFALSNAANTGGLIGGGPLIGTTLSRKAEKHPAQQPAETPRFVRRAYLAVTEREVALITLKGVLTAKLDSVIARAPRSEVTSAEIGPGMAPTLSITFADGRTWQFEFARIAMTKAKTVVEALQAQPT